MNRTIFTAGPNAPAPESVANDGKSIVNQYGNIALTRFTTIGDDPTSKVELVGQPPMLVLCNALADTAFGYTGPDGSFVQYNNELSTGTWIANGAYTGPGSQIQLNNE